MKRRLYYITLRDQGRISKSWITTNPIAAAGFTQAFGFADMGCYSVETVTPEIESVISII